MHRSILHRAGLLIALGALAGGLAHAEMRKFSNPDGTKHFKAELVRFQEDRGLVTVRRESGRESTFRLSALSEEDQKFVSEKGQLLAIGKDLRISAKLEMGKKEVVKKKPTKKTTIPRSYKITLKNTSRQDLKDLTVHYDMYVIRDNGSGRKGEVIETSSSKTLVSNVSAGRDFAFTTDVVNIFYTEPFGGKG